MLLPSEPRPCEPNTPLGCMGKAYWHIMDSAASSRPSRRISLAQISACRFTCSVRKGWWITPPSAYELALHERHRRFARLCLLHPTQHSACGPPKNNLTHCLPLTARTHGDRRMPVVWTQNRSAVLRGTIVRVVNCTGAPISSKLLLHRPLVVCKCSLLFSMSWHTVAMLVDCLEG